jgi:hypothetical protein
MKRIVLLLLSALCSYIARCQELTVYVTPPKAPINWKSPRGLLLSYAGGALAGNKGNKYVHAIGHVIIELKDSTRYAIAGMSPRSKSELSTMVFSGGYGLGIFFADIPGRLVEGQDNINDVTEKCANGTIAFITYKISPAAFSKLWQYLEEYKAYGYGKIYNGENKPREGSGAGCSAFGASFIELAGLMPVEVLSKWLVSVPVPQQLIGGPKNDNKKVSIFNIFSKGKWADTLSDAYKTATYYEPGLMYRWIVDKWNNADTTGYDKVRRQNAKGIVMDCRQYPVPDGPIWLYETPGSMILAGAE